MNRQEIENILKNELLDKGIANQADIEQIMAKMDEALSKLEAQWLDLYSFDHCKTEAEYKAKIKALSQYFALYLTDKVKSHTVASIYEKCFGYVKSSESPFLIIVAGAIASGKSTVVDCVIPKIYGTNYGIVNKDEIKASNIFKKYIHKTFGNEHGNLIEDFMLSLRDAIGIMAIQNKKSILLEQSCKTRDFLETCAMAKENGFKVYGEIVITPIAFTSLRNVYRYVTGLEADEQKNTKTARYEAFVNISDTYASAPAVLSELCAHYADSFTVYTSDILKVDTTGKTMAQIFNQVAAGPVSDISFEIAKKMYDYIDKRIDYVNNIPDIMQSLATTEAKLNQLDSNPNMIYRALPQDDWQPEEARKKLDELNAPLDFSYTEHLYGKYSHGQ
ncbi:MAG: zeta toxin family protein [Oscillospiraceae bacterium]|nr:zeta toxin family protein [Oscillospiraceae bacterium]